MPPLVQPIRRGGTPLVEAGRRGMGFDVSGVNHQHLWLWGIGWLWGIRCWQLGKDQRKNTLVSPAAATVVEGFVWAIGDRGIHPGQPPFCMTGMMPRNTLRLSTRFPSRSLGNKGRMRATCSALSPNNRAITHLLPVPSWGSLSAERIIPRLMRPDPTPTSSPFSDSPLIHKLDPSQAFFFSLLMIIKPKCP